MTDERGPLARLHRWLVLEGNRLHVTAVLLVVIYLVLDPVAHLFTSGVSDPLSSSHTADTLLSTLLSGVFLLVSIVVSINSLVVSQEQTPLGRQLDRIREVGEFRREMEALVDAPVSPTEPARFLQLLTQTTLANVQRLDDELAEADPSIRESVDQYLSYAADQTREVTETLASADSTLDLVIATMDYDYSRQAAELRRLRSEHGEDLPTAAEDAIDDVQDAMRYFVTAREYFKTLYFGREFATLSNHLLYVSLPAIGVVSFVLLHLNDLPDYHWLIMVVQTVALAPYALLAAYVVRVGTVARRTRAAGQFVVEERADRTPPWEE